MGLREFVPKVTLMPAKNFLICHSEADTSLGEGEKSVVGFDKNSGNY
jgi:hypothetical protein